MRRIIACIALLLCVIGCARQPAAPVRGVWVPDPGFTDLLHSYENVVSGVRELHETGINTLFLCAYAKTGTIFPSRVYLENSAFDCIDSCYLLSPYADAYRRSSPTGDPVRDLIDQAHRRGMRVVFWFEYGFMATHGPTEGDHPLLRAHPEWMSAAGDGRQANYNGTDYYLNGYHPGFQRFMLDLVGEALRLYPDIDGIQGDDRMPAMPADSGYDTATRARYRAEHDGAEPPADFRDPQWTAWRLSILDGFAAELYRRVKAAGDYLVCFSPNPYPWCRDNLMQNYPAWVADGVADLVSVQCYRFDAEAFRTTLDGVVESLGGDAVLLNPGIILRAGGRTIDPGTLREQLRYAAEKGCCGATFFYNEGLDDPALRKVVRDAFRQ